MSMSKSAASDQVKTQALEFLRDLQRSGMLESMVSSVQQEAAQMPIGAMTDGAKRRCPESPNIYEEEEFQHVASSEEMPPSVPGSELHPSVFHMETNKSGYSSKVSLPVGVDSLEEWGRTICELPKVKEMSCSYHELTLQAEKGDIQMSKYLSWIRTYKGPSSRTVDFKNYLLAYDSCASESKTYFPGTMEVRRLK